MRYHFGLGIGHIGIPSSNQHTAGMEVDLEENTTSLDAAPLVDDGECILGLEEEELQQWDEETVNEPDDQDSDHGAYNDYDDDAQSDLAEDDCNSLASIGGSSINFEEVYDD